MNSQEGDTLCRKSRKTGETPWYYRNDNAGFSVVINSSDGIYPLLFDRGHLSTDIQQDIPTPIYKRYTE